MRARTGTLILLRTPGLSINVGGGDDDELLRGDAAVAGVRTRVPAQLVVRHRGQPGHRRGHAADRHDGRAVSAFISEAERATTGAELDALEATGVPRAYLATAAIEWARTRRTDPEAAEALALAIEGWRWSRVPLRRRNQTCPAGRSPSSTASFPQSEWARKDEVLVRVSAAIQSRSVDDDGSTAVRTCGAALAVLTVACAAARTEPEAGR